MNFNWSYALKKYCTKIQDVYVIFFARPFFKRLNVILFHTALRGLGINNVTRGVPRLNELLKVTKNPKAVSLTIQMKEQFKSSKDKAREL